VCQQIRSWAAADFPIPSDHFTSTEDWWLQVRKYAPKSIRQDFDAVVILVRIWKECNSRVFENIQHSVEEVFDLIREDINLWRAAGRVIAV
jgi:hypothetical protein